MPYKYVVDELAAARADHERFHGPKSWGGHRDTHNPYNRQKRSEPLWREEVASDPDERCFVCGPDGYLVVCKQRNGGNWRAFFQCLGHFERDGANDFCVRHDDGFDLGTVQWEIARSAALAELRRRVDIIEASFF